MSVLTCVAVAVVIDDAPENAAMSPEAGEPVVVTVPPDVPQAPVVWFSV